MAKKTKRIPTLYLKPGYYADDILRFLGAYTEMRHCSLANAACNIIRSSDVFHDFIRTGKVPVAK